MTEIPLRQPFSRLRANLLLIITCARSLVIYA